MRTTWNGLYPALWTPTGPDGMVLAEDLADQVRFLHRAGVDGLMVLGSTGEFVHLDPDQRKAALRVVVETVPGWRVIANCSDISPRRVAELGRHAREVGASAISLLPPWFFQSAPEDLVEFFVRGTEASGLPLMLYNFPERTGIRLSLEVVAAVCDRVPVAGLKQSGAEFEYHRALAQLAGEKGFTLITGADTRVDEAYALGARGVVSGLSNAVPEWVLQTVRAEQRGDSASATEVRESLRAFGAALGDLAFPLDVAAAMAARGRPTGAPKSAVSPAVRERMERVVIRCRELMRKGGWVD